MTTLGHRRASRRRVILLAAFLGSVIVAWPVLSLGHPMVAVGAAPLFAGVYALLAAACRRRIEPSAVAAFGFLVAIEMWRQADHTAAAAFAVLAGVPVIWTALHSPRRQLWLIIAAVTSLLWAPVFVAGGRYPMSDARAAALCVVVIAFIGWVISSAVDRARPPEPAGIGPASASAEYDTPTGITSSGAHVLVRAI